VIVTFYELESAYKINICDEIILYT